MFKIYLNEALRKWGRAQKEGDLEIMIKSLFKEYVKQGLSMKQN